MVFFFSCCVKYCSETILFHIKENDIYTFLNLWHENIQYWTDVQTIRYK